MNPLRWLFPVIPSPEDARQLIRRCWGGWYLLLAPVGVTLLGAIGVIGLLIEGHIDNNAWLAMLLLIVPTILGLFFCQQLFARLAQWAAWLLLTGGLLYLIAVVVILTRIGEGLLLLMWIWPFVTLLALFSLVNAIRGCRALGYFMRPDVIAAPFRGDTSPPAR
jgi:predicted membrane channel-forming protein YqfA (hemolysin III family)